MATATSPPIGTAWVAVIGDWSKFASGAAAPAKETGAALKKEFATSGATSGAAFAGAFGKATAAIGAIAAGVGVAGLIKGTITAASDLNETINKSQVIFGKNAAAMKNWSKTAATSFGLSQAAALDAAAGFGNMFQQLGITGNRSTEMSKQIVQLAADLGSFNNVNPADVLRMVSAAMRGEYDELQRLIPNINAARVEHEALAMTHKSSAKELTAAEKATATLAIIQKDGAAAAGDFAKTSDGVANSTRIMSARVEDAKAKFGAALLPAVAATTGFLLRSFIPAVSGVIDGMTNAGTKSEQFGTAAYKVGDAIRGTGAAVASTVDWFKQHDAIARTLLITIGSLTIATWAHTLSVAVGDGRLKSYLASLLVVRAATAAWATVQWIAAGATWAVAAATGGWTITQIAAVAWAGALTVAQWALNAAFLASPIGWIVLGVVALVAAVILAWKHSATFRDVVIATWEGIKVAALWTWENVLKPIFTALVDHVKRVGQIYLWLWQNAVVPAWNAIKAAFSAAAPLISAWLAGIRFNLQILGTVFTWLWQNIISPWWEGVKLAFSIGVALFQVWFGLLQIQIKILGAVFVWLWQTVIAPVWDGIKLAVAVAGAFLGVWFSAVKAQILLLGSVFTWLWKNVAVPVWSGISAAAGLAWSLLSPIFNLVKVGAQSVGSTFSWLLNSIIKPVWNGISSAISAVWNNGIKPIFNALMGFVRDTVPGAFRAGVDAIGKAWDKVRDVAKIPIRFVVDTVINQGIIDSYNWLADKFGVSKVAHVALPKGFATGGLIRGPGTGTSDSILASVAGAGAVRVSNGEYIVPAKSVREFGVGFFDMIAGKRGPQTRKPGDGSEGLAFALGGLIDVTKNAWDYASNPSKITDPLRGLFGRIPGPGLIRDASIGMLHKGVDGLAGVLRKIGENRGHSVASWLAAQKGKPYIWASAGPEGYDCCVPSRTLIYGPHGPKRIDEMQAGDLVYSRTEAGELVTRKVVKAWYTKDQLTYRVKLRGRNVDASANHPFLRVRPTSTKTTGGPCRTEDCTKPARGRGFCSTCYSRLSYNNALPDTFEKVNGYEVDWVRLDELQRGDLVVVLDEAPDVPTSIVLPDGAPVTERFAWLLGALVGDGTVTEKGIRLAAFGDFAEEATEAIREVFGLTARRNPSAGLIAGSVRVARTLKALGLWRRGADKRVPEAVWAWPRELQLAFCAGYAAADGHVSKHVNRGDGLSYSSCSRRLIDEVRTIHLQAGHRVTNVTVNRRAKPIVINGKPVKNALPLHSFAVSSTKREAYARLKMAARAVAKDFTGGAFGIREVQGIQALEVEPTYDLNIEEDHNFVADGVVVHNSGIVSAVWNILHDRSPYSHTFSTMDQAGYFPKPGHGFFTAGWANAGEQGGGSVGHTAGNVMGIPFESAGGVGVVVGSGATSVDSFAHVGHYDDGGVIPPGISAVINSSRRNEMVLSDGQWNAISKVADSAVRSGSDGSGTTINVYPERKDFDIRDLEALQARQDALARLGRPR